MSQTREDLQQQLQDDVRDEVPDALKKAENAVAVLEQADSCETNADLLANLREAEEQLRKALREARSLVDKAARIMKALEAHTQ